MRCELLWTSPSISSRTEGDARHGRPSSLASLFFMISHTFPVFRTIPKDATLLQSPSPSNRLALSSFAYVAMATARPYSPSPRYKLADVPKDCLLIEGITGEVAKVGWFKEEAGEGAKGPGFCGAQVTAYVYPMVVGWTPKVGRAFDFSRTSPWARLQTGGWCQAEVHTRKSQSICRLGCLRLYRNIWRRVCNS